MAVRFWIWHQGYVRLSLSEGETLQTYYGGATEEGWSSRAETWTLEGGTVTNEVHTDGRDCDGRLSTQATYHCPVADLLGELNCDGVRMPSWQRGRCGQRDYSAEAMGY